MKPFQLLSQNLTYYWRTNLVVVVGVATAVAVLSGALLVGDSVRASAIAPCADAELVELNCYWCREMREKAAIGTFAGGWPQRNSTAPP